MDAFTFATITLVTELFVTASVLYIFWEGYKHDKFHPKLLFITLAYEALFNISYMATRVPHVPRENVPGWYIGLAAFHGIFSLLMFLTLVVFFILAWLHFRKQENYFKEHALFSKIFIVSWLISVFSGIVFYIITYL